MAISHLFQRFSLHLMKGNASMLVTRRPDVGKVHPDELDALFGVGPLPDAAHDSVELLRVRLDRVLVLGDRFVEDLPFCDVVLVCTRTCVFCVWRGLG